MAQLTPHPPDPIAPAVVTASDGDHYAFLNHAATVKVAGSGVRSMSVVQFEAPEGFAPPLHSHRTEDELFVILDGEVVLYDDGDPTEARKGTVAYLPHGRPHSFLVVSDTARILTVTASTSTRPRFDELIAALGSPIDHPIIPEPSPIDPALVAQTCDAHGIDVVGPPPSKSSKRKGKR